MTNGHFDIIQEVRGFIGYLDELKEVLKHLEDQQIFEYRDSQDLFVIASQEGLYLFVNTTMAECLGFSRFGLVSQSWMTLIHPDDRDELLRSRTITSVRPLTEEDKLILRHRKRDKHPDGSTAYARIHWLYITRWTNNVTLARGRCLGDAW